MRASRDPRAGKVSPCTPPETHGSSSAQPYAADFQCRAAARYYGGDHVIFLGAVEAYAYNRHEPLLFARGGYGRFLTADEASAGKSS